eukprot:TRINITY_DN9159_c0_g3_i5.p1 TRINITY_DN9159_c0_g3~~TRINITY_DN9159_c0_g3_i5.p1  ORF type:complete len:104 (-),score=17.83 TRINITY_DN9159_c0_g3_i5:132-443(-)
MRKEDQVRGKLFGGRIYAECLALKKELRQIKQEERLLTQSSAPAEEAEHPMLSLLNKLSKPSRQRPAETAKPPAPPTSIIDDISRYGIILSSEGERRRGTFRR